MTLNFNTITDERGEEIADLFDQVTKHPNSKLFSGKDLFIFFTEKYIDTAEELFIATVLFTRANLI